LKAPGDVRCCGDHVGANLTAGEFVGGELKSENGGYRRGHFGPGQVWSEAVPYDWAEWAREEERAVG
jgi:hypothetical protein